MECGGKAAAATPLSEARTVCSFGNFHPCESGVALCFPPQPKMVPARFRALDELKTRAVREKEAWGKI